jgi:anthranilate phosphoribosyltransferase
MNLNTQLFHKSHSFSHILTSSHTSYILNPCFYEGGDADENAQALRDVLAGGEYTNAKRDSILLNAGKHSTVRA